MKIGGSLIALLCFSLAGCGASADSSPQGNADATREAQRRIPIATPEEALRRPRPSLPKGATTSNLVIRDVIRGTGPIAEAGKVLLVRYVAGIYETGEEIEAGGEPPEPVGFLFGSGDWSLGFETGVRGMRVGGRRMLVFPTTPANTPPGSQLGDTLVYMVDLLRISEPGG